MQTNKVIEIYLPKKDCFNKELAEKQSSITKILKGTPFEKDTNTIFEHLVRVREALHITESNMESRKTHLQEELDVIKTLLALNKTPQKIELRCGINGVIGLDANIPQSIVGIIAHQIKNAVIELFNQSPYLFCGNDGKILNPTNKEHLKAKEQEIECKIKELNTKRGKSGKATYTKETPNQITDTFRMLCAIKFFCKCDGFNEWQYRGGKTERNRCIFKCLQVFSYTTIRDTAETEEAEAQRNYEKSKVIDAEKSNIEFIPEP